MFNKYFLISLFVLITAYPLNTFAGKGNGKEDPLKDTELNRIPDDLKNLIEKYKPIRQKCPSVEELKHKGVQHDKETGLRLLEESKFVRRRLGWMFDNDARATVVSYKSDTGLIFLGAATPYDRNKNFELKDLESFDSVYIDNFRIMCTYKFAKVHKIIFIVDRLASRIPKTVKIDYDFTFIPLTLQ